MAERAGALAWRGLPRWPGLTAGLLVGAFCLGPILPLALRGQLPAPSAADLAALRFTLVQAALSAVLSVALAIPLATALSRRRFAGRGLLVALLGAPFILPVIVAVLGLLAIFGRGGLVNSGLVALGLAPVSIYGLGGVVLAHVFLNLPLATRLILLGWQAEPAERFRLAASLGVPVWRVIGLPMLARLLPGVLAAVFLVCLTSFAVALTLGGGPAGTTLELAIYQALRFDFDPGRAAMLALLQLLVGVGAAGLALAVGLPPVADAGRDGAVQRPDRAIWDVPVILLGAAFLVLPLGAIIVNGLGGLAQLPPATTGAALRSLAVALAAAGTAVALALALAIAGRRWLLAAGMLPLAVSALVTGAGLILLLQPLTGLASLALPVTALVNALAALPFALRAIAPALAEVEAQHGRLADTLGLCGWARLRILILPRLRRPVALAAGLAAALSMGDLGIIALFASEDQATLPLLMQRLMGAYRMDAAAGVGLVLVGMALGLFVIFDRLGRTGDDPAA